MPKKTKNIQIFVYENKNYKLCFSLRFLSISCRLPVGVSYILVHVETESGWRWVWVIYSYMLRQNPGGGGDNTCARVSLSMR